MRAFVLLLHRLDEASVCARRPPHRQLALFAGMDAAHDGRRRVQAAILADRLPIIDRPCRPVSTRLAWQRRRRARQPRQSAQSAATKRVIRAGTSPLCPLERNLLPRRHAGSEMTEGTGLDRIVFREVTPDLWSSFERLFERRGGPKACWCMLWRATPEEARHPDGASRKAAMTKRFAAGTTVGLIGFLDEEPVIWCSVAPRSTYRRLVADGGPDDGIWSIACLFVVRKLRGQGLTQRVIGEAVRFAKSKGAVTVEAYPVDPQSPSYRFMGLIPSFAAAGFCEVGRAGTRRHVFQLRIGGEKRDQKATPR